MGVVQQKGPENEDKGHEMVESSTNQGEDADPETARLVGPEDGGEECYQADRPITLGQEERQARVGVTCWRGIVSQGREGFVRRLDAILHCIPALNCVVEVEPMKGTQPCYGEACAWCASHV